MFLFRVRPVTSLMPYYTYAKLNKKNAKKYFTIFLGKIPESMIFLNQSRLRGLKGFKGFGSAGISSFTASDF